MSYREVDTNVLIRKKGRPPKEPPFTVRNLTIPNHALPHRTPPNRTRRYRTPPHLRQVDSFKSCPGLPNLTLTNQTMPNPTAPYPAGPNLTGNRKQDSVPYLTRPHCTEPYPTLPYQTVPNRIKIMDSFKSCPGLRTKPNRATRHHTPPDDTRPDRAIPHYEIGSSSHARTPYLTKPHQTQPDHTPRHLTRPHHTKVVLLVDHLEATEPAALLWAVVANADAITGI